MTPFQLMQAVFDAFPTPEKLSYSMNVFGNEGVMQTNAQGAVKPLELQGDDE